MILLGLALSQLSDIATFLSISLGNSSIPVCFHISFTHTSIYGPLGCFYITTTVNRAVLNMAELRLLQDPYFSSVGSWSAQTLKTQAIGSLVNGCVACAGLTLPAIAMNS